MGAQEKNRNAMLSRIVADLSAKSMEGGDVSSNIRLLRDEVRKVIEDESTVFGKFRGLVESFREIIPEEKQRYHAAVKAMSTTSKFTRQEIVQALDNQLAELKILEKSLRSALPNWRDELKAMEARSREITGEIAELRETIERLENEEIRLLAGMETREKDAGSVEKAVGELFADIGAEITAARNKVEEAVAESAASRPAASGLSVKGDVFSEEAGGRKGEALASSSPQGPESQKKCPMCGGRMDFHYDSKMWMCYTCAYEEAGEEKSAGGRTSEISESAEPQQQETEWQKKCPMCGGQMNFHTQENVWLCYTCAFEERSGSANASEPVPDSNPASSPSSSLAVPLGDIFPDELLESKKSPSSPKKPLTKRKPCPVCRKNMSWHEFEKAWRCPFCQYERRI